MNFSFVSLTSIYAIYKFSRKMPIFDSGQNSWPILPKGIFVQNCFSVFLFSFLFNRMLHLFLGPLNVLSTSFHAHTLTIASGQNSWLVEPRGIFIEKKLEFFSFLFFFSKEFSICSLDLYLKNLQVFMQKRRYWIQVKILDLSDPAAFLYKIDTIFFFKRIFHLFLWPPYMLSTSFHAKTPIFDSGQNSCPIWPKEFSHQIDMSFFFFSFLSRESCICFLDLLISYLQVFMHTGRHWI